MHKHNQNMGYGATIQTILRIAESYGDVSCLVVMDADCQHDADDIPALASPVLSGEYDLVIGRRKQESIPGYRKAGQLILSLFTRLVSGSQVADTQSGFRAYSPTAVSRLVLKQNGMAVSSEMTAEAARLMLRTIEVPINVLYHKDGSTHNPVAQGAHTLLKVFGMISEQKPLAFFGLGGSLLSALGLLAGVHSYNLLMSTEIPPVGTMLISVLLIVVGLLSAFTGVILHVIAEKLKVR